MKLSGSHEYKNGTMNDTTWSIPINIPDAPHKGAISRNAGRVCVLAQDFWIVQLYSPKRHNNPPDTTAGVNVSAEAPNKTTNSVSSATARNVFDSITRNIKSDAIVRVKSGAIT